MKKFLTTVGVGALVALAPVSAAHAQALEVVDPNGNTVGTVIKFDSEAGMLTVKTDKHEVVLPKASFRPNGDTMLFAMTQEELNAEVEKGLAAVADSVSVGRDVYDADLQLAGTIEVIGPETITIRLTNDTVVRVPANGVTPRAEGAVLGYRNADLEPLGVEMSREEVAEQARLIAEQAAADAAVESEATAAAAVTAETNL